MRMVLMTAAFVVAVAWFLLMPLATPASGGEDGRELLIAAEKGDVTTLRAGLRRSGRSVDAEIAGNTLLMRAAAAGQVGAVRELIGMGADVNGAASSGWTPLMTAVLFRKGDAVRVLMESGARVDLTSEDGVSAMDVARAIKDEGIEAELAGERI